MAEQRTEIPNFTLKQRSVATSVEGNFFINASVPEFTTVIDVIQSFHTKGNNWCYQISKYL